MGCGRNPRARRAPSSGSPRGSACAIARCAGPAASRRPACRRPRARCATACSPPPRAAPARAHVLTAHTLDDQAETVLIRMARGSGPSGPRRHGTRRRRSKASLSLVRPLLDLPKARLIATLEAVGMSFADDPSNRDPRFTRARLRGLMPALAARGARCAAARAPGAAAAARRGDDRTRRRCRGSGGAATAGRALERQWPDHARCRKIRAPACGSGIAAARPRHRLRRRRGAGATRQARSAVRGAVRESLQQAASCAARLRRTLAGALVTLAGGSAHDRAGAAALLQNRGRSTTLTTRKHGRRKPAPNGARMGKSGSSLGRSPPGT